MIKKIIADGLEKKINQKAQSKKRIAGEGAYVPPRHLVVNNAVHVVAVGMDLVECLCPVSQFGEYPGTVRARS